MQSQSHSALVLAFLTACSAPHEQNEYVSEVPAAVSGGGQPAAVAASVPGATSVAQAPQLGMAAVASGSATTASPTAAPNAMSGAATAAPAAGANTTSTSTAAGSPSVAPSGPSGLVTDPETGDVVFRTEPIMLKGFEESYTCFAVNVKDDMVIDGFKKGGQPFVHHAQFVKSLLPEPEGISTCNEQFKITWLPIFLAGQRSIGAAVR